MLNCVLSVAKMISPIDCYTSKACVTGKYTYEDRKAKLIEGEGFEDLIKKIRTLLKNGNSISQDAFDRSYKIRVFTRDIAKPILKNIDDSEVELKALDVYLGCSLLKTTFYSLVAATALAYYNRDHCISALGNLTNLT